MKYIGFIKEHDNIEESVSFEEMTGEFGYDKEILKKVTEYLESGVMLIAWMHYELDFMTKKPICPAIYYSDGVWIWPNYYSHYLNNYSITINKEFVNFLIKNNFKKNISRDFIKSSEELGNELEQKL